MRKFAGNMTFSDINKAGTWTKMFIKYIKSAEHYDMKATRRGFFKIMKKEYSSGNNSTFFSAIIQSDIIKLNSKWNGRYTEAWYTRGVNWDSYINGTFNKKSA